MTTILPVISDLQVPLHDDRAVAAVATFVADQGLDTVCVGDVLDAWQVSHWHKGLAGEFDGLFDLAREQAIGVLESLRVRDVSRSNHDDRLETYIRRYAPGISSLPELRFENFMRFTENGIRFHRSPVEIAPEWLLMHGDEGSLLATPGSTALNIAKKTGMSVVCGHTHRLGLQHYCTSFAGRTTRTIWGMEVGHLMDMAGADYLKGGMANWHQGFGILVIEEDLVTPFPIAISSGSFHWEGKRWKA